MSCFRASACTLAVTAFSICGLAQPSFAQNYPSQNVTMVVAFPAGGLADIIGRLVATKLGEAE